MNGHGAAASPGPSVVAVNPRLARLRDPRRRNRIDAAVRQAVAERTGCEPVVVTAGDAAAMVEEVAAAVDAGAPLVVVVGGDGTVRDVATILHGRDVPLAIVPVGTANLFAGSLGIPMRPETAARAIAGAMPRRVDLGRVRWGTADGGASEARLFVVGAGMGLDARVMAATGATAKRRLGRYAYFLAAAREAMRATGTPASVVADEERIELLALEVLVANTGSLIPGVLRPALPISPSDGLLDVFVVEGNGLVDAVWGGLEAIVRRGQGRSGSGRSRRIRVRTIRVTGEAAVPVEVDGDVVGRGWFEAESVPRAVRVLTPGRPVSQ
jgi:diacylglycerol kinase (ATP)